MHGIVLCSAQLVRRFRFFRRIELFGSSSSFLFSKDARFYLPILIVLVAVAALPVTWAAKNLFAGKRTVIAMTLLILFAGSCLGYPSRSETSGMGINRSQAWEAVWQLVVISLRDAVQLPLRGTWFIAQGDFLKAFGREPGIVLSDINPVYLNTFFPDWIVAAPLDGKHLYEHSRIWRYGRPQALALVKRGLDQKNPVYALFVSQKDMEEIRCAYPRWMATEWALADTSARDVVILKLNPNNG